MGLKTYEDLSDEELVLKIKNDKFNLLFELIYKRYYRKVMEKCNTLIKNRDLSAIFAQEVLTKAFEKLDGFKAKSSFSSWLYSITYNHCIDYLRANKKLHYPEWNLENELPEIIDVTPEDLTELHYSQLLVLLELLHTEEKALLLMKYQDDLSLKEIAASMRLTESAVKMRLLRARARLLFLYKNRFGSYN